MKRGVDKSIQRDKYRQKNRQVVIIVDDEEWVHDLVRSSIAACDLDDIISVHSFYPESFFELIREVCDDTLIIFLDYDLKGSYGEEVMDLLEEYSMLSRNNIVVIAHSKNKKCNDLLVVKGARYLLDKPCDPKDYQDAVECWISIASET